MGDWCPSTLPSGGSVSTSAGGRDCVKIVGVGMTGVDVLLIGMAGVPAQEARSAAISRKLFRVRTMRRFVMVPQLEKESKSSRSTPVGPDFEFQRQESLTPGFAVPIHYTRERIKRDT